MTRLFALLSTLVLLFSWTSDASDWVLTPDSERPFQALMSAAQRGEAGRDVRTIDVSIAKDRAQLVLVLTSGERMRFTLTHGSFDQQSDRRFFVVTPETGVTEAEVKRVTTLVQQVFQEDPWQEIGSRSHAKHPSEGGPVSRWFTASAGLRYIERVVVGVVGTLILLLIGLWRARPDAGVALTLVAVPQRRAMLS